MLTVKTLQTTHLFAKMARTKQMVKHKTTQSGCSYIRHVLATKRAQTRVKVDRVRKEMKNVELTGGIKRTKRWKPGRKALHEIRLFQRSTNLVLNKAPFQRLVREITEKIISGIRFQSAAIGALQVHVY